MNLRTDLSEEVEKRQVFFLYRIQLTCSQLIYMRFDFIGWSLSLLSPFLLFFISEKERERKCDNKLVKYVPHKLTPLRERKNIF